MKIDDNYFPTGELRMDRAIYMMSVNTENDERCFLRRRRRTLMFAGAIMSELKKLSSAV